VTPRRKIEVILKISDLCNLRCSYCFDAGRRANGTLLEKSVIASLPRLFEALKKDYDEIDLIFHGGEPFLAPPHLFLEVMDAVKLAPGIEFHVQTNLASSSLGAYSEVLCQLSGLSFTLDGPQALHDAQRTTSRGAGSYSTVLQNLDWLRSRYPLLNLGVLCTLSKSSVESRQQLYPFFQGLGVHRVGLNPVFKNNESLSNHEYFQILDAMFRQWIGDPKPLDISLFVEALKWVTGIQESPSFCNARDCFRGILSVSPRGFINPCLHWHDDNSFHVKHFTSFVPYLAYYEQKFRIFENKSCDACRYHSFCRGGCPYENVAGRWHFCEATQKFLAQVQGYVTESVHAIHDRERLP